MTKVLSVEETLKILINEAAPLGQNLISLNQAVNRVLADSVCSTINVPHFQRSKVDGYAIHEKDCLRTEPMALTVVKRIPAGANQQYISEPGKAYKVMTGAPIPCQTGAVIKQEHVKNCETGIIIKPGIKLMSNIESEGSILTKGQLIAEEGQVLTPLLIELIAAAGINQVKVYDTARVCIINSGSELELPGEDLSEGRIFNSNRSMFLNLIKQEGHIGVIGNGKLPDDIDSICKEIDNACYYNNLVIITGGNAQGDWDLTSYALKKIGAQIIVSGINMKPGQHTLVARFNNKLIFNFPGNPHAGYILFYVLIRPLLKKLEGQNDPLNKWFNIALANSINIKNSRMFCQGALVQEKNTIRAVAVRKGEHINGLAPLILDISPFQGQKGDIVQAMLI